MSKMARMTPIVSTTLMAKLSQPLTLAVVSFIG